MTQDSVGNPSAADEADGPDTPIAAGDVDALGPSAPANLIAATERPGAVAGPRQPMHRVLVVGVARWAMLGVWMALVLTYALIEPGTFLTQASFSSIFGSQQPLIFLAVALFCTVAVGEFVDLSVASVFALSATLVSVLVVEHGWNVWFASLAGLAAAVLVGCFNGWLIVYMRVSTIAVTLGMSTFVLGICLWLTNLNSITGLSPGFAKISTLNVLGLPISFFYGIGLVAVCVYVLALTPLGRSVRFVGANREVSRLVGIPVNRIRFGAFVLSTFVSGLGGILAAAGLGGFNPSISETYLLPTFAAVFLGAAVVRPGEFNALGTWIAIYFLATGIFGLELLGASGWVSDVFYGGVVVIAVAVATAAHRSLTDR